MWEKTVKALERLPRLEMQRFFRWIFIIFFFIFAPAIVLYGVRILLRWLAESDTEVVTNFSSDISMILLVVYLGALGALVSYILGRTVLRSESDSLITVMAKLLLGSAVAFAAFLFMRSGMLINFFYPKISTPSGGYLLTYHGVLLISFLAGLLAPTIVRRVQSASGDRAPRQRGTQAPTRTDDDQPRDLPNATKDF